ncbi:MAG: hypothetical protein WEC81_01320 [Patescibacteria group bacterium]
MKLFELISTAHAQLPGSGGNTKVERDFGLGDFNFLNPFKGSNIDSVFGKIVGIVMIVAAVVAFFYLIVSGFQYITAGGDAAKAQTARQGIVNALIGIVVILVAYIVLRYVGDSFSAPFSP